MPFKSKAQQRFMFSQHPKIAKEMASKMDKGDFKKLPEKKNPRDEAMQRKAGK